MIDVHFVPTPNGQKISIALEETGLAYRLIQYDLFAGEHLRPEFAKLNPNHKIPVIVDHQPPFGGAPHTVFETGAILQYLAGKTGQLLPAEPRARSVALQWLTWQVAGLGPMHGQAHHFVRYAPEGQQYPIGRYTREARRLLGVMEQRLGEAEYLGGEYGIADIACWPYVIWCDRIGIELADFPNLARWTAAVGARPAVLRATTAPGGDVPEEHVEVRRKLTDEQWSNLFGDRMLAAPRKN